MPQRKQYFTYVMASRTRRLYTGMTNDLLRRAHQHRTGAVEGFTKRYNITRLVYYEVHDYVWDAIAREKQIKGLARSKKFGLIESMNPDWNDLYLVLNPGAIVEQRHHSTQESGSDSALKDESRPVNRGGDSSLRSE